MCPVSLALASVRMGENRNSSIHSNLKVRNMKKNFPISNQLIAWGVVPALFLFCAASYVVQQWPGSNVPNPNRPDAIGVFMANGIYDPGDPDYVVPSGEDFDRVIMGRDDEGIAERKQEAIDYFLERFGVDFNDGDFAQGGAIALIHAYQDPRWNYRCYSFPGRYISRNGLIVHDAQWVMFVAADADLFGSWGGENGTPVPAGTVAVDGEYLIQGTNRFIQGHRRNIHLTFQSVSPIFDAASGDIKFDCRLSSSSLGAGAALGRQETYVLPDGMLQVAIQNVLQFPPPEWTTSE